MPDLYVAKPKEHKEKKVETKPQSKLVEGLGEDEKRAGAFSAYCYYPDNIRFTTQDPEEKIILLLRQHIITNVGWIVLAAIMVAAPLVLTSFPILAFLPANFKVVAVLIWYLVVLAFVYEKFLSWFFSVYIVTDERVIDVDFLNLIYRKISAASIDKIQDVTVQSGGVVQSLFNYGNVLIQTASELPLIVYEKVPRPDSVARILRKLIIEEEQEKIDGRVR